MQQPQAHHSKLHVSEGLPAQFAFNDAKSREETDTGRLVDQEHGQTVVKSKPQKSAMICTYYNQLYNGKCYSCTQLSTLHFVINLLEPACDMLARGWPRAGTRN